MSTAPTSDEATTMAHQERSDPPQAAGPTVESLPGHVASTTAPRPTDRTIRRRTSVPLQAWRFAVVNLRMIDMIRRSHQH